MEEEDDLRRLHHEVSMKVDSRSVANVGGLPAGTVAPVSTVIFTLDEEIHLSTCLASLTWCNDIIVVDSFSRDRTTDIAARSGARVFQHAFTGFGDQRNWALENTKPRHPWALILDADERVPPALAAEMAKALNEVPQTIAAFRVRRRFHMWGRWLRYSSLYPTWVVRLVRVGRVSYVNRGHAETQQVNGEIRDLQTDLIDENLKGIDEWFERQNRYSGADAEYELKLEATPNSWSELLSGDPLARRAAFKRLAIRLPARPLIYFFYSYFFGRGFLDGKDGLVFCMMRALYQGMVVAKKHALRRRGD